MIKLSDYVMNFITEIGVKHVFMLPGGGCMHLVDSLGRNPKLRYIPMLHEQACAIAAEAYGQYTNHIGVCLVTTGPGGTNAITGVAGAWIDSTPMLIISGQAKREDMIGNRKVRQMGIQEVDIISLVKPITKYAATVMQENKIKYHLQKAIYEATTPRKGPVWLEIPLDVQGAMIDENVLEDFSPPSEDSSKKEHEISLYAEKILEMLSQVKRPVFLIGNGIRSDNANDNCLKLLKKIGAPVLTTWKMSDFISEDDPLYCGRPGIVAQRGANFTQQFSDLFISIGARLDLCQTGFNHRGFAPNAKKVIIDVDKNEISKLDMDIALAVNCRAGDIIEMLLKAISDKKFDFSNWLLKCKEWQSKYPVILPEYKKSKGLVNTYYFLDVLSELLDSEDILVPASSGAPAELTQQAFKVKKGQRILNTPGLGAMGFDLPAAIGACIASNGRRTIGIAGDGGFQMNIQELETLRRLNLPIIMFILNNNGYGSIRAMQQNRFNSNFVACDPSSGLTFPNIIKVARAYNLPTAKIKNQNKLKAKISKILKNKGPLICEVMVDPTVPTAPRVASEVLPDGRIISKPMEDLWPFLDKDELKQIETSINL